MKFIDRLILLANLCVVVMTMLSYLAPTVNPNFTWIISFFGLFYPVFILMHVGFMFYWMMRKPSRIWISLFTIVVGYKHFLTFMPFNGPKEESDNEYVTILNYNISNALYAYPKDKSIQSERRDELVDYFQSLDQVDVFCFQEVADYGREILKKSFSKDYHFYYKDKGATIVSKHPIIRKGEIDFGTITNSCLWADIVLPFDTIRVYSFHLQSNQISNDAEKLASQQDIDQKKAWYDIKGMLRKFKNKHIKRTKQATLIAEHAKKSPYKVLMGGDLNDPPQSYTYNIMNDIGRDAYREAGAGIGTTYHGVIPLLRIDYLFVDPKVAVQDCNVIKNDYSDHYGLLTTLKWPGT